MRRIILVLTITLLLASSWRSTTWRFFSETTVERKSTLGSMVAMSRQIDVLAINNMLVLFTGRDMESTDNEKTTMAPRVYSPQRSRRLSLIIRFALFIPLSSMPMATLAQEGIFDLGTLSGASSSTAFGVSADGSVVVGYSSDAIGNWYAFRWTNTEGMVDLGTLGGLGAVAKAASADGSVVVGYSSDAIGDWYAFRWTSAGGMVSLGTLAGGTASEAWGASVDGSVVVGYSDVTGGNYHAFRWTSGGGMVDLGTLTGGTYSAACAVSADGSTVVGDAEYSSGNYHAFRWTSGGGMVDLGTLTGGTNSSAFAVSADGSVVTGYSETTGGEYHAFRWASATLTDLGTLGGPYSEARGISADGSVVVGTSDTGAGNRAFRWTEATGMQTVEDWLRDNGVSVPTDITDQAYGTNADGSVVVGQLSSGYAFIARGPSGLVTLNDLQNSLAGTASGATMALTAANTLINGAHSRPLARRVSTGKKVFWVAGDWGRDDHGSKDGDLGLAELGFGRNFGPAQIDVSLGYTWTKQKQVLNSLMKTDGAYLLAEALIPVKDDIWATLGGYYQQGTTDLRRGYLNAGVQDYSSGQPNVDTWSVRARLEQDAAYRVGDTDFSPYIDLIYTESQLDAYTETGGGFPAQFDNRKAKATELRVGVNTDKPLTDSFRLLGTLEGVHRFEHDGAHTSGEVIGLFPFDLTSISYKQDWLRLGAGVEGKLAEGRASLQLNVTTEGETPNAWLAANWLKTF